MKPEEIISEVSVNTFKGERTSFSVDNSSFDSLWKAIDFVYDPVSFNRYDPIVSVCFELNIPENLRMQGVQFIDLSMVSRGDPGDFVKVSPPGYLHQNTDVRSRKIQLGMDAFFELDYQIDNVLKFGDENCHPDPSFDRDECVIKQLLDVII